MALAAGDRIGIYEIVGPLGKGGMGEVYRARDSKLEREVAIKVLPAALANNPERLARFDREAKVLAALNHPNIATIYGHEDRAIVMELVEGPTLGDRLKAGPLKLEETIAIAQQIIAALEAAHEKGIVHRDLKPANVKAPEDAPVKVLDFGLATAVQASAREPGDHGELSPTLTMGATEAGMILGTAAYMSPEQAAGKQVDKRADIWSFGVVLWEMLTGQRLFKGGETVSHTLADVLRAPVDFEKIPAGALRELLERCLDRDVKTRLRDIGEARVALARVGQVSRPDPGVGRGRPTYWAWAASAVFAVAAAALAFVHFREQPPERRSARFQIAAPEKFTVRSFCLSPDGRYLAFVSGEQGRPSLWVRPIDSLEAQTLPGTEGISTGTDQLFWSPDSAFIGFVAQGKLKKVSVHGGPPQALADAPAATRATWGSQGVILIGGVGGTPLQRVPATGGVFVPVTKAEGDVNHFTPEFLPDGRHFLYFVNGGKPETNGIYVGSLQEGESPVRLSPDSTAAFFVPAVSPGESGHLLFLRESTLMAQPFDSEKLKLTGELFPVAEPVTQFSVSASGALAYSAGGGSARLELAWMDRTGRQIPSAGPPGDYRAIRLSPDEKSIAFYRNEGGNDDIWVMDMTRGIPTKLTFDSANDNWPIWSQDGLRVLWSSIRGGAYDLYVRPASGAGNDEVLIKMGTPNGWANDWSRDGKFVVYQRPGAKGARDLWIAPQNVNGKAGGEPFPYLESPFDKVNAAFSPDGRWIAYVSNESGRNEVYVQAFPLTSEKKQISTGGGADPAWRKDGAELFYMAANRSLMAVSVRSTATTIEPGIAKALFSVPGDITQRSFAASRDGQRFLVGKPLGDGSAAPPITVVLDWRLGLKK